MDGFMFEKIRVITGILVIVLGLAAIFHFFRPAPVVEKCVDGTKYSVDGDKLISEDVPCGSAPAKP